MRLLRLGADEELILTKNLIREIPPYAILSHTWGQGDDDEVILQDITEKKWKEKPGYQKILFCGQQAKRDGLEYFWVDTCCIDKTSSAELSEAINSMFRWYQDAKHCYVHLADVSHGSNKTDRQVRVKWKTEFRESRWFTRGWTLQELIAPRTVDFFSSDGWWLGDKQLLVHAIHEITHIPIRALQGATLSSFRFEERISWSDQRITALIEDQAYSLLGILGVYMPLVYGEGAHAFERLRLTISMHESLSGTNRKPLAIPEASSNSNAGRILIRRESSSAKDQPLRTLTGHTDLVSSVSFSPNGRTVASASRDKTVRFWAAETGVLLRTLTGHTDHVSSVSFSPNGRTVASTSRDKTVRLWAAETGVLLRTLTGHTGFVYSVSFSPDGQMVGSASHDKTVRLWATISF